MLSRILEPEVMDSVEEAIDYDSMDHSQVNRRFVDDLWQVQSQHSSGSTQQESTRRLRVLDVGTGTAQIPIELYSRVQDFGEKVEFQVLGVDLAQHMLQLGQRNVIRAGFALQIRLEQIDAKDLPYADGSFDWVISNSIIHHIPVPQQVFLEMARVVKRGGLLFVRDLMRPVDLPTLTGLVRTYSGNANLHQQTMFYESLHAALTVEEVHEMTSGWGLPQSAVRATSDRHWTLAARKTNEGTWIDANG